jgi:hypothetical protein
MLSCLEAEALIEDHRGTTEDHRGLPGGDFLFSSGVPEGFLGFLSVPPRRLSTTPYYLYCTNGNQNHEKKMEQASVGASGGRWLARCRTSELGKPNQRKKREEKSHHTLAISISFSFSFSFLFFRLGRLALVLQCRMF